MDPLEALSAARKAWQDHPEDARAALEVGRWLIRLGSPAEALEMLLEARHLDPNLSDSYLLAALVLRDIQRPAQAKDVLGQALQAGIDVPEISEQLAYLQLAEGAVDEALGTVESALEGHPNHPGLTRALGLALGRTEGRHDDAATALRRSLELGVDSAERVHLELGILLLDANDAAAALPHLETAVEGLPDEPEAHYRLGTARRATGDAEGAREALTRFQTLGQERDAREHRAKTLGTRLNGAQAKASANDLRGALADVDALLDEFPDEGRAHALRAKVLFSLGRRADATAAITRARELLPNYAEHHYLEAYFVLHGGQLDTAEAALRRALDIDPNLGDALTLLGALLAEKGRFDDAEALFRRALDTGHDSPDLRRAYAKVLERLGRDAESAEQLEALKRLTGE